MMTNGKNTDVSSLDLRLANLRVDGGLALGAEIDDGVINISATAAALGLPAPRDVDDLLQKHRAAEVGVVLDAVKRGKVKPVAIAAADVAFAPLVTRPEKIICVGLNYRERAAETNPRRGPRSCW
jgi:2-keto-4-pentenoate hydratase/2-oxohepta-3-ene-1,7-dioic acid hydratase in catechol pathway